MNMKKNKAFTLIEILIAVTIIIILSVVSLPIYKSKNAEGKKTEGYALLKSIYTAQYAYYREYGYFLSSSKKESYNNALGVDARMYKYFTSFMGGVYSTAAKGKYYFYAKAFSPNVSLFLQYNVTKGHKISEALDNSWSA